MKRKIPITDGIPRDPLDTKPVSRDKSLSKFESSGSEESLGPGEKRSGVEDDEVGAIEKISDVEVGAIEKISDVEVGAIEKRSDVEVGAKVGDDVGVLGLGPGAVVPETLATIREREMYINFILLSGF